MSAVPGRLVVIREGHGEAQSIENLVVRTARELGLFPDIFQSIPDSQRFVISSAGQAVRAAEIAAVQSPSAVLLTADLDDACPKSVAPEFAAAVREKSFSFPIAIVLFYREFETLAISVSDRLPGRELKSPAGQLIVTLTSPSAIPEDPEQFRDAKGWVGRNLMGGKSYKPTVHQLPLTRAMKVEELRAANLSSFRRLESGLRFLGDQVSAGQAGVYPELQIEPA